MVLYDKVFEAHPVSIGKAISKMERWVSRARAGGGLQWCGGVSVACGSFFLVLGLVVFSFHFSRGICVP